MPKTIAIPTNVGFTSSSFSLVRTVAIATSPYSGKQRTQEYDGVYWQGEVSLPPMRRSQAVQWQSFLMNLQGPRNFFLFGDPDAKTPQGTYNGGHFQAEIRVNSGSNVSSVTLSFSGSTITAGTAIFDGLVAGDFFTVSGAVNEDNNGTFKITTKTSDTVVVVDASLTTESSTAACKVRQNVKGSTALSLQARGNSFTGTLKQGDYLAVYDGSNTANANPIQLVMCTEDAQLIVDGAKDHYSVRIEPKLRADLANNRALGFDSTKNRSRFRLTSETAWDADRVSNYGITLSFVEVV